MRAVLLRRGSWSRLARLSAMLVILAGTACTRPAAGASPGGKSTRCDKVLPPIASGYGADGSYGMESVSVRNPAFRRKSVTVFFPQDAPGRRPVIFFSHGYGPNLWEGYRDLIRHTVSRGYILVYSTYPVLFSSIDGRYDALWGGFQAAVDRFGSRMDLSRVGFLGHSFGGGATPAMAFRGLVQDGWGANGAFMMELAPWYVFQMTADRWRRLPDDVLQMVEVYDRDHTNDHRMAIHIFQDSRMQRKYFLIVRSTDVDGCTIVADHSTPGRSRFLEQKQYAVFRPLDALAECAFAGSADACRTLASLGRNHDHPGYHPLTATSDPTPDKPESYYRWPWSNEKNPAASR